jgi:hypothetical protein
MRNLFLLGLFGLALNANAADSTLTCKSTLQEVSDARVTFSYGSVVKSIEIDDENVWALNPSSDEVSTHTIAAKAVNEFAILRLLARLANPLNQPATLANVSIIAPKKDKIRDLGELLAAVTDDGGGIVYLELFDSSGNTIGNALLAGWAGTFKDCK